MIVNALLAVIRAIMEFILGLLPSMPPLPAFVVNGLDFLTNIICDSAGILCYLMGETLFHLYLNAIFAFIGVFITAYIIKGIKKLIL